MPSKVEEILKNYSNLPRGERIGCWQKLRRLGPSYPLTQFEYTLMLKALDHEDEVEDDPSETVPREAMHTFFHIWGTRFSDALAVADTIPRAVDPNSLNDWFWVPFQRPAIVLGLWHPITRGRDDLAQLMLQRYLTPERFPRCLFQPVLTSKPSWQRILPAHPAGSYCFVGRMGLYGREAQKRWGKPARPLRFGFPDYPAWHGDPAKKKKLDPRFHYILERVPGHKPVRWRASQDDNNVLTDYAVVQRYTVTEAGKQTFVYCLAGATWVGTLAAAQWVAEILTSPHLDQDRIPLIKGVSADTRLEVLLRVKHDDDYPSWRLADGDIEICKMFLGDSEWNHETQSWRPLSDKLITILCEDGDPNRPVALEIDGQIHRIRQPKRNAPLLSAIYEQTHGANGAVINPAQLMRQLPAGATPRNIGTLRKWLSLLQTMHFRGAFLFGKKIWLQATFTIKTCKEEHLSKSLRVARVGR